jgi:lipopolysaccharide export system protein LptC
VSASIASDPADVFAPRADAALYARVQRHSRRVRMMRWGVPVLVVCGVIFIWGSSYFNPIRALTGLNIDPSQFGVSGTKITMQAPRLAGYTSDGRPYQFNARAAAQDIKRPDALELSEVTGSMELQSRGTVQISARSGLYETKADLLRLNDNIKVNSSSGYDGDLMEAAVEIKKGRVTSDKPVAMRMMNGKLNAQNLEIINNGEIARFGGGVVVHMMLNGTPLPAEQAGAKP